MLHLGMNPPYLPALAIMAGADMTVAGLMWLIADAKGKGSGIEVAFPDDRYQEAELGPAETEYPHTLETFDELIRLQPPGHPGSPGTIFFG